MCGLVGILSTAPVDERDVWRMTRTLAHRGPDALGVWADSEAGIGLGHARLSIVDLSPLGCQPMASHTGRYVIAYNGELYNAADLRAQIENERGAQWRGHSDTEVLLACVEHWSLREALNRAEGMFAFALWDRQTRQLSLARDRAGEKPLYYGWAKDRLIFASELKALRACPGFDPEIDPEAVARFTQLSYIPAPFSIYRDVRKLSPGAFITVGRERSNEGGWPEPRTYWCAREIAERGLATAIQEPAVAIAELEDTLRRSVQRQMQADVPLGAFLSGGIDSSTIVSLMQAQSARAVQTFTVGFDAAGYDESSAARLIARHLGTEHHELRVTDHETREVIPRLSQIYDEPFADASQLPSFLICALARQHVTVALSGDGGDELLGGYNRYAWLPKILAAMGPIPPGLRSIAGRALALTPPPLLRSLAQKRGPLGQLGRRADSLAAILVHASGPVAIYETAIAAWTTPPVHSRQLRSRLDSEAQLEPIGDFQSSMMLWDFLTYLPDDVLTKVDRASMSTSLEVRCPYLDPAVIALAWRLPLDMKINRGVGKWALRQVLHRYVPEQLVSQPKSGFAPPIAAWLRGPLRDWADDLLSPDALRSQGYFDAEVIQQAWSDHRSGRRDVSKKLWPLIIFAAWFNEWAGRETPAAEAA